MKEACKTEDDGQNQNSKTEYCKMLIGQAPVAENGPAQRMRRDRHREDSCSLRTLIDVAHHAPGEDIASFHRREDMDPIPPGKDIDPIPPSKDIDPIPPSKDIDPIPPSK